MILPRHRLTVVVALASCTLGFVAADRLERSARADGGPSESTVYVPPEGLAFRTLDGRLVARLAYDHRGGFFDVYDANERPAATVRTDEIGEHGVSRPTNPLDMHIK